MVGIELLRCKVAVFGQRSVSSDAFSIIDVVCSDDVSELMPRVLEDESVRTFATPWAKAGHRHVTRERLADGVVTGSHREGGILAGEEPSRSDMPPGVANAFPGSRHVWLHSIEIAGRDHFCEPAITRHPSRTLQRNLNERLALELRDERLRLPRVPTTPFDNDGINLDSQLALDVGARAPDGTQGGVAYDKDVNVPRRWSGLAGVPGSPRTEHKGVLNTPNLAERPSELTQQADGLDEYRTQVPGPRQTPVRCYEGVPPD
jgi:hypothetical protein